MTTHGLGLGLLLAHNVGVLLAVLFGRRHVPYRGHVLTHILKNALGGNCRTVMVACVSPHEADAAETSSTLR
jgi:hypothetical protein